MPAGLETELKLRFAGEEEWEIMCRDPLLRAREVPGTRRTVELETIYYDTPSHSLQSEGLAYRLRRQGEEWVATVKADGLAGGGLHQRQEWSAVAAGPEPDISPFLPTPVGERLEKAVGGEPLAELFRTYFRRTSVDLIPPGGGRAEFAADRGEIRAKDRRRDIREIELELKEGSIAGLLRFAASLAGKYPLLPEAKSKYYRGLELAGLEPRREETTVEKPAVHPSTAAGEAFSLVLSACVRAAAGELEAFAGKSGEIQAARRLNNALLDFLAVLALSRELVSESVYEARRKTLLDLMLETGRLSEVEDLLAAARTTEATKRAGKDQTRRLQDFLFGMLEAWRQNTAEKAAGGRFTPVLLDLWGWALDFPGDSKRAENGEIGGFVKRKLVSLVQENVTLQLPDYANGMFQSWLPIDGAFELLSAFQRSGASAGQDASGLLASLEAIKDRLSVVRRIRRGRDLLARIMAGSARSDICAEAGCVEQLLAAEEKALRHELAREWKRFRDEAG